ncbi:beta-glucuronidase-like [Bacillus rossius redtenbacheri]|uniref:beta-glucuronidase-like n=1 Tax=Bacillus rossius redtenbacheri TaxID=93214 RepID=UPI002FDD7217
MLHPSIFLLLPVLFDSSASTSEDDVVGGILYPRPSESREVRSLDGLWNFRIPPDEDRYKGVAEGWYEQELWKTGDVISMPVPASYNDIPPEVRYRRFFGLAWYQRDFFVPRHWSGRRVWLRFGSVFYAAVVWVNGQKVASHSIGHLPFAAEVSKQLKYGEKNLIVVSVNNTLSPTTVPQGKIKTVQTDNGTKEYLYVEVDFFQYAGIDRPVFLYTTPQVYIDDITVTTNIENTTGVIDYTVTYGGLVEGEETPSVSVSLYDRDEEIVATSTGAKGRLEVPHARLWWPYLMHSDPAYLYQLQVNVSERETDVYHLPVGIRTVSWNSTTFFINGKPLYLRGFGRHEDSDIRGKGVDFPLILRDYNLIRWTGANGYRTSHYPYAEEIMDFSDQQGIVIIDECPIVNAHDWSDELLRNHKRALTEMVRRDKNRPSVVMWSVANEASTTEEQAEPYFKSVTEHARSLDGTRAITQAINQGYDTDRAAQFLDVICVNEYLGFYKYPGVLGAVRPGVLSLLRNWHAKHRKPLMVSEYGGDSMVGLHLLPSAIWSEDYQAELLRAQFAGFDDARAEGLFAGEMIWNFADFMTDQRVKRIDGNRKGVFSRNRQPKQAAFTLRKRYLSLAKNDTSGNFI